MIKKTNKYFLAVAIAAISICNTFAQTNTNSPYSKFGVGNIHGQFLPQNRAMGNLAYGISSVGIYNDINVANPASYSQLKLTAFDIGLNTSMQSLKRDNLSENSFNANLGHLAIAVPVSKKSALSFGLLPYSILGYGNKQEVIVDNIAVDHIYEGEGGLSKAYLGYGIGIAKNLSVGFNMSYVFGNMKQTTATEYNKNIGFLNSRKQINSSLGGLTFDIGAQYVKSLTEKINLTLGYTTGLKSKMNNNNTVLTTNYISVADMNYVVDTIPNLEPDGKSKINLPANHNFGFSISRTNKWLVGADFRTSDWSDFRMNNTLQNLGKTWGVSVGGQIIPNINSVTNYWSLIDYRAGINYDKTYATVNNTNIDVKSINFGMGFPLVASASRAAFYKINFAAEIGTRGALKTGLVRENFYNFYLGFTINDRWFQKYKYD